MHGLQLAQTLKENDPGIEITWVVRSRYEPLVRASSAVDKTITFFRTSGVSGFMSLCGRIRRRHYDVVLDLQGLARSGLMTFFSKAPRKIGRSDAREGATLFYKELVPLPRRSGPVHPVDILLEFCRVFGFETKLKGTVQLTLSQMGNFEKPRGKKLVTIAPEGRRADMTWDKIESLAKELLKEYPSAIVQIIAARPIGWVEKLKNDFGDRLKVFRTSDPLKTAGSLQNSDMLIANDSDTLHMAAAMRVKTIGLFGPTDGNRIGPYPLSEPGNCAINAPQGDLSHLSVARVLEEVQRRL